MNWETEEVSTIIQNYEPLYWQIEHEADYLADHTTSRAGLVNALASELESMVRERQAEIGRDYCELPNLACVQWEELAKEQVEEIEETRELEW